MCKTQQILFCGAFKVPFVSDGHHNTIFNEIQLPLIVDLHQF